MYVKCRMNKDLVTIIHDASISLAFQLMKEKNISQVPVVKDGKLVGLITERVLAEFTPSKATTLSMYELNYVLNETKVEDIMIKEVVTCDPEMLIEYAAVIMNTKNINSLPIIEGDNNLVGIITKSDIIEAFIELLGVKDSGARISVAIKDDKPGTIADILAVIKNYGVNITHITNFNNIDEAHTSELVIRLNTIEVDELIRDIEAQGHKILRRDENWYYNIN